MQGTKSSGRQHYVSKKGDMFGTSSLSKGFFVSNQEENDFEGYELKDALRTDVDHFGYKSVVSQTLEESYMQLPSARRKRQQQTQVVMSQCNKQQESSSNAQQCIQLSPPLSSRNTKKHKKRAVQHQLSQKIQLIEDQSLIIHDQIMFSKPVSLQHIQKEKTLQNNNNKKQVNTNSTHNKQQHGLFHFDDDDDDHDQQDGMQQIWGQLQTKKALEKKGKQNDNNNGCGEANKKKALQQQQVAKMNNTEVDDGKQKKKKKPKYEIVFEPSQLCTSGQQQQRIQQKSCQKQRISNSDNSNQINTLSPTTPTGTTTTTNTTSNNNNIKQSKTLTPEHLLRIVTYPIAENMLMRTNIIRSSGFFNLYPEYHLHFQPDQTHLLSAKKVSRAPYSTFIISNSKQNFQQNSPHYLGKAKGSVIGDQLDIFGPGLSPSAALVEQVNPRQFLATVVYGTRILQSGTPRNFTVYIKHPEVDYYQAFPQVKIYADEIPLNVLYQNPHNRDKIIVLRNKKPQYSEQLKAYSLNFNGRARMGSVKNFILQHYQKKAQQNPPQTQLNKPVILPMLFGKMGDNQFNMDISSPLSPMIAFGIALSSFDDKFFCE